MKCLCRNRISSILLLVIVLVILNTKSWRPFGKFWMYQKLRYKKKYLKKKQKKNIKQENKNQNISRHLHSIWFVSVWILLSICFYLKYQWNWTCTKFQINSTSIVWGCRQHSTTLTHRQTRMKERKQCLTSPPLHFTALSGVESENKNKTKKKKNNAQYNYLKNNHWLNKQQFKSKKQPKPKPEMTKT